MTLEEALKLYEACDTEGTDCGDCPLQKEKEMDIGDLGFITIDPCRLLTTARLLLEKVPCTDMR